MIRTPNDSFNYTNKGFDVRMIVVHSTIAGQKFGNTLLFPTKKHENTAVLTTHINLT